MSPLAPFSVHIHLYIYTYISIFHAFLPPASRPPRPTHVCGLRPPSLPPSSRPAAAAGSPATDSPCRSRTQCGRGRWNGPEKRGRKLPKWRSAERGTYLLPLLAVSWPYVTALRHPRGLLTWPRHEGQRFSCFKRRSWFMICVVVKLLELMWSWKWLCSNFFFFKFQSPDFKGGGKESDCVQPFRQGAPPRYIYLVYLTLFSWPLTFENYHLIVYP